MEITKSQKTALVVGATGLIGQELVQELLGRDTYSMVRILVRRASKLEADKLDVQIIDFDKIEDHAHLFAVDDIFCCLGTTMAKAGSQKAFFEVDFTYVYESARLGAEQGAHQFLLVSSAGANTKSMFFYSRVKGQVERAVLGLDYWAVHIFRPSLLLGDRKESRWAEGMAKRVGKSLDRVFGRMLGRYRPVEGRDVAIAMADAAQDLTGGPHIHENETIPRKADRELRPV